MAAGVFVTGHASQRFGERFPDVPEARIVPTIYSEVMQALEAQRRAARAPKWVTPEHYPDSRNRAVRFVWNEPQTRCYPILQRRDVRERPDEFSYSWIVKTTLCRIADEEIEKGQWIKSVQRTNYGARGRSNQKRR